MSIPNRLFLLLEDWGPLFVTVVFGVFWYYLNVTIIAKFSTDMIPVHSAMLTVSAIIVTLLSTIKAIIASAHNHQGIRLLSTNTAMFNRFLQYIFRSIIANIALIAFSMIFLIIDKKTISTDWLSWGWVLLVIYTFASFVRVQFIFHFILKKTRP